MRSLRDGATGGPPAGRAASASCATAPAGRGCGCSGATTTTRRRSLRSSPRRRRPRPSGSAFPFNRLLFSVAGAAVVLGGCGGGDGGGGKAETSAKPRAQLDIHVGGFPDTVIGKRVRLEGTSSSTQVGPVELDADPAPFEGRFRRVATGHVGHLGAI